MVNRLKNTSDTEPTTNVQIALSNPWKLTKTCFLIFAWIIFGLHMEIIAPTILILAKQTNVNFNGISSSLVARNGGRIAGAIIGGLMQDIVNRYSDGVVALGFLITSIVLITTPYIGSLMILSIAFFFHGFSNGLINLGGNNLLMRMWGDRAAAPLNIVHFGYGIGAIFANLLVRPFLGEDIINSTNSSSSSTATITSSNISIPYSIIAGFCLLVTAGHTFFSIREYKTQEQVVEVAEVNNEAVSTALVPKSQVTYSQYSPKAWGYGHFCYGLLIAILGIAYMFFLNGLGNTFGKFYFVYLKSPQFSVSTTLATWGMVLYWLSYVVGRLICAIVTLYISVDTTTSGIWICAFILSIVWFIYIWVIDLSVNSLLILGTITGLIFSTTFPTGLGFFNQRVYVNPLLGGLFLCSAGFGGMFFMKLAGIIMDYNTKYFPVLLIISTLFLIVCFVLTLIISYFHKRKFNGDSDSTSNIPPNSAANKV